MQTDSQGQEELAFGEFLVAEGGISRAELAEAIREQVRNPGVRLGEIIAWLGYLPYPEVDRLLTEWYWRACPRSVDVAAAPAGGRLRAGVMQLEYEIVSWLARGGIAEVWKAVIATGPDRGELVAIKTIRDELAHDARFVELFVREATIAFRLRHPCIIHVKDYGMDGGVSFMAAELLRGATLRDVLARRTAEGKLPPRSFVIGVIARVCDALEYMHDGGGLLHNDLSPENIMITFDGAVKVIDLGSAAPRGISLRNDSLVAKISYLPPEVILGRELDHRSDIYSLGVTLYESMLGVKPFDSDPRVAVPAIASGQARDPREHDPEIPDEVAAVILRATSVEPAARHPTAGALADELRGLAHGYLAASEQELGEYMSTLFPLAA